MAEKPKKRRARGEGNIIYREKKKLWEARFVIGIDPGTGKEIRKSVYARTQKEVRQKMTAAIAALDSDDYKEPCKMSLASGWISGSGSTWAASSPPQPPCIKAKSGYTSSRPWGLQS